MTSDIIPEDDRSGYVKCVFDVGLEQKFPAH